MSSVIQHTVSVDAVKAAHDLVDKLAPHGWQRDTIRAALPPLPEPERPTITPAKELNKRICREAWGTYVSPKGEAIGERCIRETHRDIIALLEWEMKKCQDSHGAPVLEDDACDVCISLSLLLQTIRDADAT